MHSPKRPVKVERGVAAHEMKKVSALDIRNLPREISALVRDGVYSLYTSERAEVGYVLVTNRDDFYCLTDDGALMKVDGVRTLEEAEIDEAVMLEGAPADETVLINYV